MPGSARLNLTRPQNPRGVPTSLNAVEAARPEGAGVSLWRWISKRRANAQVSARCVCTAHRSRSTTVVHTSQDFESSCAAETLPNASVENARVAPAQRD